MSYILDALRKSELERQMLAGQSLSTPSLLKVKKKYRPGWIFWLVALAGLAGSGLILWMALAPSAPQNTVISPRPAEVVKQAPPEYLQPHELATETLPEHVVKGIDLTHEQPQKIFPVPRVIPDRPAMRAPEHAPEAVRNAPKPAAAIQEVIHAEENKTTKGDPLKGLPPLNISGYIHTAQGVGIVMVNDQLYREGDEIFPGLRLIKVLDDKAVFNYKGYEFTR